jgi:hypothetical protein
MGWRGRPCRRVGFTRRAEASLAKPLGERRCMWKTEY